MPVFMPLRAAGTPPAWPCRPWLDGPWRDVPPGRIAVIAAAAAAEEVRGWDPLPAPIERMRALPLDCYPGWFLVEVLTRFSDRADGVLRMLLGSGGCRRLDGCSAVLHAMNAEYLSADLDATAAEQYLSLFTSAVRGGEGRFRIVTKLRDLSRAETALRRLRLVKAELRRLETWTTDAGFGFAASLIYGRDLFRAEFSLLRSGFVEMTEDDLRVSELPVVVEQHDGAWQIFEDAPPRPARGRSPEVSR